MLFITVPTATRIYPTSASFYQISNFFDKNNNRCKGHNAIEKNTLFYDVCSNSGSRQELKTLTNYARQKLKKQKPNFKTKRARGSQFDYVLNKNIGFATGTSAHLSVRKDFHDGEGTPLIARANTLKSTAKFGRLV
jgi:hypothetical protein